MHKAFSYKKKGVFFLIVLLLFTGIWKTQKLTDELIKPETIEQRLYFPNKDYLSVVSLGYNQLLADILWINTTTYLATHLIGDQNFPWLHNMLDIVTSLDSKYEYPYYFGGIILSMEAGQIEKSNQILTKGMKNFPDSWRFPFYIGFNHFHFLKDFKTAAKYMKIAANHPDSPDYVKTLPATLYQNLGDKKSSIVFLKELYLHTKDEVLKTTIKDRLIELVNSPDEG